MNLYLQLHEICFTSVLVLFIFVIILNTLTFISFVSFGICIFGDKTLQLPLHLSKSIINRQYLSSIAFKLLTVCITMHDSSFKERHFSLNAFNAEYVRFIHQLQLTEKSYIFQFKDTSVDSIALNQLDILP